MKAGLRNAVRAIARALRLNKLFWYLYALFGQPQTGPAVAQLEGGRPFGTFTDRDGNQIPLIEGLRDRVKPGWQAMLAPPPAAPPLPSRGDLARKLGLWQRKVGRAERLLGTFDTGFRDRDVLEIGAFDGATAFALARAGAKSVTATDIAAYYIQQTPGEEVSPDAVAAKNRELERLRHAYGSEAGGDAPSRVRFVEDDISASALPSASVDVIASWEVLEHLTDPERSFREMARVLRPGGVCFHEYNPFFAVNGGHSLCTLDFLWGHARLATEDVRRYLQELRPQEEQVALSFFEKNLNRMTLADLRQAAEGAGLIPLAIVPWTDREHLALLTSDILTQARRVHPTAELLDLISPFVWVVLQKG